jgi:acetylornithine/N-succinyldiaminopimelate aminotransferase
MTIATHPFDALMDITTRPSAVFVRGEGSWLWDDSGKRYLDFIQGWAVNCLGHSPPAVVNALAEQAKLLLTPSPAFYNAPSLKLAEALVDHSCFDQVFFANSGAEANEGAIKLARKFGALHRHGAHEIITFEGGFHGRTLATMSASGKKAFEPLFEPKVSGFRKAKLNDLASVARLIGDNTVGVMLEPIQGEAGVWPATDPFLRELRSLTKEHGLLLIFDEIQTGMGRTGTLFQYEHADITPDIMTLGKGIGGGVPLAARHRVRLLFRTRRPRRHVQRQSADVRRGACCFAGGQPAGIFEVGGRYRIVSGERAAADVGAAWSRRSTRPRAAAGARPEEPDRGFDRRAGV